MGLDMHSRHSALNKEQEKQCFEYRNTEALYCEK